jgi:phosphoribosylglycinamide formyltransferase-1
MTLSALPRLGILISGRGTNLLSLIRATEDGRVQAKIGVVVSNRPDAGGLDLARAAGLPTLVLSHRGFPTRPAFDRALADVLLAQRIDLVCLAGFMRVVGPGVLDRFPNAVLNIHPSLLPAFPGAEAQQQAVDHGVKVTGVTVHFVTAELDAGPIVLQRAVPVLEDDTGETLAARILEVEHDVYPEAVQRVLTGRWRLVGRRVLFDQPDSDVVMSSRAVSRDDR